MALYCGGKHNVLPSQKTLRRFELKDGGYYGPLPGCIVERTKGCQSCSEPEKEPNTRNNVRNNPTGRIKGGTVSFSDSLD